MRSLSELLTLDYGQPLPAHLRTNSGYPVYGSNGVVGHHEHALVEGPGAIVGRKGSVGKVHWSEQSFWPIDTTYYVTSKGDNVRWLYRVLDWLPLELLDTSTGVPGLNRNDVYRTKVFRPSIQEQSAIATVLDTLDTEIGCTEALIAKLDQIKEGLITDLLTRGIDENGQVRPPADQAPHLYKDSPNGSIPKDWEWTSWGACTEEWAMGPRFSAEKYTNDGNVATLRTTDMELDGGINHSTMPVARLDPRGFEQHFLRPGDFVITRSGTCGICGVFYGHELPVLPGAFLIRYRFRQRLDPEYMACLMNSAIGRPLVSRCAEGGVQKNLRGTSLCRIEFPRPPIEEQFEVNRRLEGAAQAIRAYEQEVEKLKREKAALMDDLLTGRVHASALLGESERAAS